MQYRSIERDEKENLAKDGRNDRQDDNGDGNKSLGRFRIREMAGDDRCP